MQKLRSLHLYLGCLFAPLLLFFALSGIWQTLGWNTPLLQKLSSLHTEPLEGSLRTWKSSHANIGRFDGCEFYHYDGAGDRNGRSIWPQPQGRLDFFGAWSGHPFVPG